MQSITLPEKCLGCKAQREYVSDGRAMYLCGSSYRVFKKRLKVKRSLVCLGWTNKAEVPSASEIQETVR